MKIIDKLWSNISLHKKRNLKGYIFVFPFIVGFILFFVYPLIQSIIFSLSEIEIGSHGFTTDFVGLENYYTALFVNPDFIRVLVETLEILFMNLLPILIFSFIIANILNQKFKGRLFARVLFFLPIILSSAVIDRAKEVHEGTDPMASRSASQMMETTESILEADIARFLTELQVPEAFLDYVLYAIEQLSLIINFSAIPILIFLAGLQSIPPSLYESAKIDGATFWDKLWKITLPLISPLIITNIVFIIIDSFTSAENEVMRFLESGAWGRIGYGVSTAMSLIYFAIIIIILAVICSIVSRYVIYQE